MQHAEGMHGGHHNDSGMPTQEGECMYESDGTDTDEDLHCGAEPYWVDEAAITGACALEAVPSRHHARRLQGDARGRT